MFRLVLGPTQPPIQWVSGAHSGGCGEGKVAGHKADHSAPSTAMVMNVWSHTSTWHGT
jgi:hypothetical protein